MDGCRAKIDRAREHVEALYGEFDAFMKPNPNTPWGIVIKHDGRRGEGAITWRQRGPTPLRWAVLLGEFLYDLRSSLDHLARALVIANNRKPTKKTEFPVFWKETDFEAESGPKIKGISSDARTVIESLQPYRAWPDHPKSTTIWAIHDLCNTDKHRVLNLTDPWVFTGHVVFTSEVKAREDLITFTKPLTRMRLHDDAVIAAYEWDPAEMRSLGKAKVKVDVKLSLDIALAEGQWAPRRPNQPIVGLGVRHFVKPALKFMDETLAKFDPFFA